VNVDLLRHADVASASLTKYAASDGDLLVGGPPPQSRRPDAAALRRWDRRADSSRRIRATSPASPRGPRCRSRPRRINAATPRVVEYLAARPKWPASTGRWPRPRRENFLKVAPTPAPSASMVSFELARHPPGPVLRHGSACPKGPSFGLKDHAPLPLSCTWAIYDLVTSQAGLARLPATASNRNCSASPSAPSRVEAILAS